MGRKELKIDLKYSRLTTIGGDIPGKKYQWKVAA
jgi:hypothetical protein